MHIVIAFMIKLLVQTADASTKHNMYNTILNKRAMLDVMKETDARSSIECASHCTITNGCRRAQWRTSGCELLMETELGEAIELGYEDKAIYMCNY